MRKRMQDLKKLWHGSADDQTDKIRHLSGGRPDRLMIMVKARAMFLLRCKGERSAFCGARDFGLKVGRVHRASRRQSANQ